MDKWKAEQGRGRKKIQMCEKVGKSRRTAFFQLFVALEGRKVGSLKGRVPSQLARGEMKNYMPLWREIYFKFSKYLVLGALLEIEISQTCTPLWREAHFEVKNIQIQIFKTLGVRTIFGG